MNDRKNRPEHVIVEEDKKGRRRRGEGYGVLQAN